MRLKQANLGAKNEIACFIKKTKLDDKIKNVGKKDTLNKTKHVFVQNKLSKLSEKVNLISTKRLTKDLK